MKSTEIKSIRKALAVLLIICVAVISLAGCSGEADVQDAGITDAPASVPSDEADVQDADIPDAPVSTPSVPSVPVLMGGAFYTGMTQVANDSSYRGGYYYADRTEDTLTVISNCCFTLEIGDGEGYEDYIARCASEISGAPIAEFSAQYSDEYSAKFGYPVYIVSFIAGQNEASTLWDMLIFSTDSLTYAYSFATALDFAEEKVGLFEIAIEGLFLA